MTLEEELKQTKPFANEIQKLVLNISFTSSWLNAMQTAHLKSFGITPSQYNVLRILKGRSPEHYCNHEIAGRMIDKSSNVTRIIDKLLSKQLVSKQVDTADRRIVNISINERGLALLDSIEKKHNEEAPSIYNYDVEKAKLMNEWLDELRSSNF